MKSDWRELAAIFSGGFVGAVARAELVEALPYPRAAQGPGLRPRACAGSGATTATDLRTATPSGSFGAAFRS
jgi:hypothetical protein